jgi:GTP-binding protein
MDSFGSATAPGGLRRGARRRSANFPDAPERRPAIEPAPMTRRKRSNAPRIDRFNDRRPVVAIIGRPNVGKSTLFNRLTGTRDAVVMDIPGVTRDRHYGDAEWRGRRFRVVDTGGYVDESAETPELLADMREQVMIAVGESDVVIFLMDVKESDNPVDALLAGMMRRGGKPCLAVVNKCEKREGENAAYEFARLGLGDVHPVSAMHGSGTGDMLDALVDMLPRKRSWRTRRGYGDEVEEGQLPFDQQERPIRLAIVGRQNVGKSTLVNTLLGQKRVVASPVPGTTRDAIDTPFETPDGRQWILVDTAGIRRRGKIERGIEGISVMSAMMSMERADVVILALDATQGLTEQDKHIAGYAVERGCAVIIAANKWDAVEKDHKTADQFTKDLRAQFGFLNYAPVVYISALTGQRAVKLWELAARVYDQASRRIETSKLNAWLDLALRTNPPPMRQNRNFKANYVAQTWVRPLSFSIFCNDPKLVHFSYTRYLINSLRDHFGVTEVPIKLRYKAKAKKHGEHPTPALGWSRKSLQSEQADAERLAEEEAALEAAQFDTDRGEEEE